MTAYWDNLSKGLGKADALQEAQLTMIRDRRASKKKAAHPLYWAAFTLTGQWQ
jgi:CHAT domain-containing protein